MITTNIILLFVFFELILIAISLTQQLQQQHRELIEWIDRLAEMVGEAIDKDKETH